MDRISRRFFLFFVVFLVFLLSSCTTHMARKDGPPPFYVDESKIPNAVPKPEPLAKYGNMKSYRVFGTRYYTLRSSKHYEAIGMASWYGTQFHHHSTSSGERYNMLAMTAAHKTLPLPTYVEVTNLRNHRKIIVKVNDRGPFVGSRLIDLSYVAAKKLHMLGHGTTPVRIKAIDVHKEPQWFHFASKMPAFKHRNRAVYLQVGAFRNKGHAVYLQHRLVKLLKTPINIFHSTARKNLYQVRIGPIKDTRTATTITHHLHHLGIKPNTLYGAS